MAAICGAVACAFPSISRDLRTGQSYNDAMSQGHEFYREGLFRDAADEYTKMVTLRPDYSLGYEFRAMADWRLGDYAQSAEDETTVLGMNDACANSARARWVTYQSRGYDYKAMGNYPAAIRDLSQAIAIDSVIPDDPNETANVGDGSLASYKGRAEAYFLSGQYRASMSDLNRLIARNPRYPANYVLRGRIYSALGETPQADAEFNTAIRIAPHETPAYGAMFDAQLKAHDGAGAQATAQAMMRNNPNSPSALGSLGWYQYETGNMKAALASDRAALARDGSLSWVDYNVGLIYAVEGEWASSKPAYEAALRQGGHESIQFALPDVKAALVQHPGSQSLRLALAYLSKA